MDTDRTIVVGGGLAGLTAAATLARAGRPVTVVEGAEHLGGRARSRHRHGYDLNLGPHALYRAPGGLDVLQGPRRAGPRPPAAPRAGRRARRRRADPGDAPPAAQRRRPAARRPGARRARRGRRRAVGRAAGVGVDRPRDRRRGRSGRRWPRCCARPRTPPTSTSSTPARPRPSCGRPSTACCTCTAGGRASSTGWPPSIRRHGGEIVTGRPVERGRARRPGARRAPRRRRDVAGGRGGRRRQRSAPGGRAAGGRRPRRGWRRSPTRPSRSAWPTSTSRCGRCRRRGSPTCSASTSRSTSTSRARSPTCAPDGGAVLHVGRYLRPGEEHLDHRAGLEAVLDLHQPDWRDHVVDARYVPRSMVSGDHARVATRGTAGRPRVDAAGVAWPGPRR